MRNDKGGAGQSLQTHGAAWRRIDAIADCAERYLFFNLPLGKTEVVGGMGRVELEGDSFGGLVSFLGFFTILLPRCSPLGMTHSLSNVRRFENAFLVRTQSVEGD
ncbi:hypothetical protein KGA65_05240 [Ideonella sp. B7]|uniref:hypothetical protein n=1 Tax=Ideonella benzenivorans TaxID=2831643 RepID=UPI001CED7AC4|nr:hypothetical protein [Ideonella benzenivorans]MCA6215948.1 hypothetical protein [Ideonella benzenivorans]